MKKICILFFVLLQIGAYSLSFSSEEQNRLLENGFTNAQVERLLSSKAMDSTRYVIVYERLGKIDNRKELGDFYTFLLDNFFLLLNFQAVYDMFGKTVTFQSYSYFDPSKSVSLLPVFTFTKNEISNFKLRVEYESDNWLFINKLLIMINDKVYEFDKDFERNTQFDGDILEYTYIELSNEMLASLMDENKHEIYVKLDGKQYYHQEAISLNQVERIRYSYSLYRNLSEEDFNGKLSDYFFPPKSLR